MALPESHPVISDVKESAASQQRGVCRIVSRSKPASVHMFR